MHAIVCYLDQGSASASCPLETAGGTAAAACLAHCPTLDYPAHHSVQLRATDSTFYLLQAMECTWVSV
jgi:hypothetical protein